MKIVVDGVFFQLASSGIARVWRSILTIWARDADLDITLLDRGDAPRIDGITAVPFPRYHASEAAADSALLQKFCDHTGADAFVSTYYSSPLETPMALMVYDMIPELFDFDMRIKEWREKEVAISFAQRFLCISQSTQRDLLRLFPEINPEHSRVAYCGVDRDVFRQRAAEDVSAFRQEHGLTRPYFLFVGSRVQHMAYKNSDLFFDALGDTAQTEFDVLCVGGEPEIEARVIESLPKGVRATRTVLTDDELSLAYAGAAALVYPSLYEGFGMPVIEAMACGCPVITTEHGSLAEAAGDAALLISGQDRSEMARALDQVQDSSFADDLRTKGLSHAANFTWEPMAEAMLEQIRAATAAREANVPFFAEWQRLRALMADVDHA